MKKILKVIAFLFIFCLLWCCTFKVLWLEKASISTIYDEPKKSLDIVYFGASNAFVHFNPVLAFDKYGFTTGMAASGDQPVTIAKYLVKDAEKYQDPKLYVIDLNQYTLELDHYSEADTRNAIDLMPFSLNRLQAIDEMFKYIEVTDHYDPSKKLIEENKKYNYIFSFLKYHNSWKNISKDIFVGDTKYYKGLYFSAGTVKQIPVEKCEWPDEKQALVPEVETIFMDLINLIKERNLNVLFVIPVKSYVDPMYGVPKRFNTLIDIIKANNLDVINFNDVDELSIDFDTDFYNNAHLNAFGATKYTLYFAKYLKEHYDLEDHRQDEKYSSWESEYERFKKNFKKYTDIDYDDLLKEYKEKYNLD